MFDKINTSREEKARLLVEKNRVIVDAIFDDRVQFKVEGENNTYVVPYDVKTKETMCNCQYKTHKPDNMCSHELAVHYFLHHNV